MKKLIFLAFFISLFGYSAGENKCGELEKFFSFNSSVHDRDSLQRGLGIYKNYWSSCHTLRYLRWNRLQRDLDIPKSL